MIKRSVIIVCVIILALIIIVIFYHKKSSVTKTSYPLQVKISLESITDGILLDSSSYFLFKEGFIVAYNVQHKQPASVSYILTSQMVNSKKADRTNYFVEDTFIATVSASVTDYRGSGYDRGHLAPAADMRWSAAAMQESFMFSNISPQIPGFNRGIWRKLENKVRKWAMLNDSLYIVTGPVLNTINTTIGDNQVGVPSYFFKVILDISYPSFKGIGFILPNEKSNENIFDFAVSIDSVENLVNYNFFPQLDSISIEYIESQLDKKLWK